MCSLMDGVIIIEALKTVLDRVERGLRLISEF